MSRPSAPASDALFLARTSVFRGEVSPPGSKSIANRALLLSAVASGTTELVNLPRAIDVQLLAEALPMLGVRLEQRAEALAVVGSGGPFPAGAARLHLGNAGTAMRPLTALVAAGRGDFVLDGDEHMQKRPIADLVGALSDRGVRVTCSPMGTPPVRLTAAGLPGGIYRLSGAVSSQFVSALLLAAPLASSECTVVLPATPVSLPYIDLTIAMMGDFGVRVERGSDYRTFRIPKETYVSPGRYVVEADASAATYFLAAGALPGCGPVRVNGVNRKSRQGDAQFAGVLERMGASVLYGDDWTEVHAGDGLHGIEVDMNAMPDAALTLAVLALFARGSTYIHNVANLRVKESERIQGLRAELEKLGAQVDEEPDALRIHPPESLRAASIATYNDHRMAMAFALAAFGANISIENPSCTAKTYPDFFEDFLSISDGTA